MATAQAVSSLDAEPHHKRTKSSVLKSFIHKRTLSKGEALSSTTIENLACNATNEFRVPTQFLPIDHPQAGALSELQQSKHNQGPMSQTKFKEEGRPKTSEENGKSLHKKTMSTISLKSLAARDSDKNSKTANGSSEKPKKTKSSTNLASLLSRPRSMKNLMNAADKEGTRTEKDKENRSPTEPPSMDPSWQPPIYTQFSSQHFTTQTYSSKFLENEIDLYTPQDYSPGKQRNFYNGPGSQPTLGQNDGTRRPKSSFIPSSYGIQDIGRQITGASRRSVDQERRVSFETRSSFDGKPNPKPKRDLTMSKRGSRVMAAVAALGTKSKAIEPNQSAELEVENVDAQFEAMLDRRNIPEHQRHKMRSLAVSMKKDFIKQDWAETLAAHAIRPGSNDSDVSADGALRRPNNETTKMKRPRSRTFTLSKSSKEPSTAKKTKSETPIAGHSQSKSWDSTTNHSRSLSITGAGVASTLIAKAKGQLPDDFVVYLRKVKKPESVEVGKLHKLRLLLRNEIVAWTDEFIGLGGMTEIVGLLHRTLEVEWREEHEDALLHEVLLCLKALCTTALALQHLNEIQSSLFPTLIHMLFDEEKKGPSEFTTRNIVTSLLFTYLKSAPLPERPQRAQVLLSYLRDQEPKEEERPVPFVLQMRRDRPYRVWCKEAVNVTKEVFWIFLHNLNVVSLPSRSDSASSSAGNWEEQAETGISSISAAVVNINSFDAFNPHHLYMLKHFPQELPPVPAAPYVGGVEWDATNYLASHLDLINGILSSLESKESRNVLRELLKVSGWERCMGATLRTCKEKFYGGVHAGLRCWVAAAVEDGWDVRDVRCGPSTETKSPVKKSPAKKKVEQAPKIEMPKLDFEFEREEKVDEGSWI